MQLKTLLCDSKLASNDSSLKDFGELKIDFPRLHLRELVIWLEMEA